MGRIPRSKINSTISDGAASCEKARGDLVRQQGFTHIIEHRCIAHLVNLVCRRVLDSICAKDIFSEASKFASFVANDSAICARLKELQVRRVRKASATRWYSAADMLESLVEVKSKAGSEVETLLRGAVPKDLARADALRTLQCSIFWTDVRKLVKILRPLACCVAVAETASSNLGEAMKAILLFAKALFYSDWDDEFIMPGITTFLGYFNSKKLGQNFNLLLTSYYLDRRNKLDFITKSGREKVLLTLTRPATQLGYSRGQIENDLVEEFKNYSSQRGELGSLPEEDQSSEEWWDRIAGCLTMKRIALRVVRLKASSANIERTFSAMKYIQGSHRHAFSLKTFTEMARIRVSETVEEDDIEYPLEHDESPIGSQQIQRPKTSLYTRLKTRLMSLTTHIEKSVDLDVSLDTGSLTIEKYQ